MSVENKRVIARNSMNICSMKKIGQASDIANMATFLMTDQSSWITGQVMPVDGGMSSLRV